MAAVRVQKRIFVSYSHSDRHWPASWPPSSCRGQEGDVRSISIFKLLYEETKVTRLG
jgi:hypothetical protein